MQQKSIKKNTIYNLIKTISAIVFPLITFPYIARVLLAENTGKINFSASIVSYFSLIASLGISTYAIRECSAVRDDKDRLSRVASQIFSINMVTTIVAYLLLIITLIIYRKLDNYRTLILIQSLSIVFTTIGADWINAGMEDFKYITIRTVAFQLLSLILMFVFIRQPGDYVKYVIISLISSSGANIVNFWYRRRYCNVRFTFDIDWRRHFTPILFLFVMLLAQNIFNNVDTTMLGLLYGDREVGIYSAAHKMSNIISQLVASILWVIMPRMSYYFEKGDYGEINRFLKKVLGFNFLLGLPCAIGTIMLSRDIVYIVAGEDFQDSAVVLQILMIGFIITLIGGNFLGNAILLPSKQEKYYMIVCCITAVINVVTNRLLIPLYGARAAAGTTTFCALVIFILTLIKKDKKINVSKMLYTIVSPLFGCLAIILICYVFYSIDCFILRFTLSICCSVITYGITQIIFKNELLYETAMPFLIRFRNKKK